MVSIELLVNSYCRALWNLRTFVNINLCATLFIAQLIFVVGADKTSSDVSNHQLAYVYIHLCVWLLKYRPVVLQLPFYFNFSSSLHLCGC